jgi:beta-phosphoglucomutase-like phosphatase (HAD superfamily)
VHPGIVFPEAEFYAQGGVPTLEIARRLVDRSGLDGSVDFRVLAKQKENAFFGKIAEVVAIEKVVSIARSGRGRVPMAVASGGNRHMVERTLRHIGVLDWFAVIVGAEDTARHKPEPDVFLEAARRLHAAPAVCTVYEDTDIGLLAARRAGMRVVDVRTL